MGALESLIRAVGYGGWGMVALGWLGVTMWLMAGGRRRCGLMTVPVGSERERLRHSQEYAAPPHRRNYRSSRRRV